MNSYIRSTVAALVVLASCAPQAGLAADLGFRYDTKTKACLNSKGQTGLNPEFRGECGDLRRSDLMWEMFLSWMDLSGSDYSASDLRNSNLRRTRFVGAKLSGAKLDGATLDESDFTDAELSGVSLVGAFFGRAKFHFASLAGQDLRTASLRYADFYAADLTGADFTGNQAMHVIRLEGATLDQARLRGAYLYYANLREASLVNADLTRAILFGADLTDAMVLGTKFTGAIYDEETLLPFSEEVAKSRGMIFVTNPAAQVNPIRITGRSDGTCAPSEITVEVGKKYTFILQTDSGMFLLRSPSIGLELMAMRGMPATKPVTFASAGSFPFECGFHGAAPLTQGLITAK